MKSRTVGSIPEAPVAVRGSIKPFGRLAEDDQKSEASSPAQAPPCRTITEGVADPSTKEADRVDVTSWPKTGIFEPCR